MKAEYTVAMAITLQAWDVLRYTIEYQRHDNFAKLATVPRRTTETGRDQLPQNIT